MTALEKILQIAHLLPNVVLRDVNKRIGDWLASGGNEDDPYIHQQLRFAENYLKRNEKDAKN